MQEGEFETIFSMYGRLNDDIEGQGIGLYLVRKIINAAGGKILVESQPGNGSTFTAYFAEGPNHGKFSLPATKLPAGGTR